MLTPTAGTVPETLRPDAATLRPDAPDGDRPSAEEPSTESLAAEARRVAQGHGPAGADEQAHLTDPHVADLRERAAGPGPAPNVAAERLGYETGLIREHLGAHYADPDAALDRLHALDADGRAALAGGDGSVLGERRPDTPEPGLQTDALVAHRDVYDRHPDEASWVEATRDQERAASLLNEIDPEPERPTRSFGVERGGPNDPAGDLEPPGRDAVAMPGLQESMEHRVVAHAMSPHQI